VPVLHDRLAPGATVILDDAIRTTNVLTLAQRLLQSGELTFSPH
jgi:hypothetical protein